MKKSKNNTIFKIDKERFYEEDINIKDFQDSLKKIEFFFNL